MKALRFLLLLGCLAAGLNSTLLAQGLEPVTIQIKSHFSNHDGSGSSEFGWTEPDETTWVDRN